MAIEFYNSATGITTVKANSSTREELVSDAKAAFSNPSTERLRNVTRVRDNTGTTVAISGKIQKSKSLTQTLKKAFQSSVNTGKDVANISKGIVNILSDEIAFRFSTLFGKYNRFGNSYCLDGYTLYNAVPDKYIYGLKHQPKPDETTRCGLKLKWGEWIGKYRHSWGRFYDLNECPKQTRLRKVLSALKFVK